MADAGRILIVGGGIAGLSLAIALRRAGAAPELVERSPAWPAVGAGIVLHANAVRALRALGLGEAIEAASAPLPRWGFFDQHGSQLCETDLTDLWREVGPCLAITRIRLQEILLTAAAGVPCRLGVALTGLTQHGHRASVTFADGSAGEYDLVVGADGINSAVRRLAISPATAPVRRHHDLAQRHPGPSPRHRSHDALHRRTLLSSAWSRSRTGEPTGSPAWPGTASTIRAGRPGTAPAAVRRLRRAGPGLPRRPAARRADPLRAGRMGRAGCWHSGRVVLIGDAAHAAPPHMAEGGAMAIEDALVLAQLLHGADTAADGLGRYQARRRPRIQWVQQQSRLAAKSGMLPLAIRDAALREHGDQMLRDRYQPLIQIP